jgi:hypothetical protein
LSLLALLGVCAMRTAGAACDAGSPVITIPEGLGDVVSRTADAHAARNSALKLHITPIGGVVLKSVAIQVNHTLALSFAAADLPPADNNGTVHLEVPYWVGAEPPNEKYLVLQPADNAITISATDSQNRCNQIEDAAVSAGIPSTFAVIIGINDYPDAAGSLKYARKDATAMAKHVLQHGTNVQPEHIYLLRDGSWPEDEPGVDAMERAPATMDSIREAISQVVRKVDTNGRIIFYFSGHAFTTDQRSFIDRYYLLAHNSNPRQPYRMLPVSEIVAQIAAAPADEKVLILDSCFSSEVFAGFGPDSGDAKGWPRAMGPRARSDGLADFVRDKAYVMTSSEGNELSYELAGNVQHGLFTFYLLQSVADPAVLAGDVTLDDAFKFARDSVPKMLTKELGPGHTQTPSHWVFRNVDRMPWRLLRPRDP